MIMMIYDD